MHGSLQEIEGFLHYRSITLLLVRRSGHTCHLCLGLIAPNRKSFAFKLQWLINEVSAYLKSGPTDKHVSALTW